MAQDIYIRHVVGRCAACGAPILDTGYSDDMEHGVAIVSRNEMAKRQTEYERYAYAPSGIRL
jgi:hypothetical protein